MGQTRVVHLRKEPFDIYIGRSFAEFGESVWHNPFHVGPDGNRKEVLAKYREYLLSSPELLARLPELKGKTLGCWCKPKKGFQGKVMCHGQVLAALTDGIKEEEVP